MSGLDPVRTDPVRVYSTIARTVAIPLARYFLRSYQKGRHSRAELDLALDEAFRAVERMQEAMPR